MGCAGWRKESSREEIANRENARMDLEKITNITLPGRNSILLKFMERIPFTTFVNTSINHQTPPPNNQSDASKQQNTAVQNISKTWDG
jgi:aromatic ring-opening dioxygenase LigB subunit